MRLGMLSSGGGRADVGGMDHVQPAELSGVSAELHTCSELHTPVVFVTTSRRDWLVNMRSLSIQQSAACPPPPSSELTACSSLMMDS